MHYGLCFFISLPRFLYYFFLCNLSFLGTVREKNFLFSKFRMIILIKFIGFLYAFGIMGCNFFAREILMGKF
jgi:hypothetical protein